ncbi:MAG: membrane dipeptidase, partial [Gammaproteobacteria bacterium]|nr:membrane dipeptidase [Gammaproteobacteria bacterium]
MNYRLSAIVVIALVLIACKPSVTPGAPSVAEDDLAARAATLARESIIVDTHIDVPYRLVEKWEDVSVATDGGDFDYPRAVAGGLNAPFMSVYTPAGLEAEGRSKAVAEELI